MKRSVVTRRTIRSLDEVPESIPQRQVTKRGYIELLWQIGENEYLRCYEHRLVVGFPDGHVHHKNGIKSDNDKSNLEALNPVVHFRKHGIPGSNKMEIDKALVCEMFAGGYGAPYIAKKLGISTMPISRVMKELGLKRRPGRVRGVIHAD